MTTYFFLEQDRYMIIQSKVIAWWKKYIYMVTIVKYSLEFLLAINEAKWKLQDIINKESFFILMHLKTINITPVSMIL